MYNKEFNETIRNEVRNYNKRRKRAREAGMSLKKLPPLIKVSELKASIKSKKDMERTLNVLKAFRKEDIDKWNKEFYLVHRTQALKYFEKEHARVSKRVKRMPGESLYLDTIEAKIKNLKLSVNEMDESLLRAGIKSVEEYLEAPFVRKTRYRSFLKEVDVVMETLNISDEDRKTFFKKFEQLTPTQFLYMTDNNNIIERIYELYFKRDSHGEVILNTDEASAKKLINELFEQADYMIEDAKQNEV